MIANKHCLKLDSTIVFIDFYIRIITLNLCYVLQNKPLLVEPIDFENFILKNKTLLQNDSQRELLLYPADDISVSKYLVKK